MLAKLLTKLRLSDAQRIGRAKTRLLGKFPGDRDSVWRVIGADGKELATLAGCYRDVLQWSFLAPAFFRNGRAGDITQLLPTFRSDHTLRDANREFTLLAMRLPNV